jgi:hypothetical protein
LRAFGRGAARRPLVHAATLRDALADLTPGDVKVLITKGGVPRTNEPDRVLLQGLCCSSSSTAAALHIALSTRNKPAQPRGPLRDRQSSRGTIRALSQGAAPRYVTPFTASSEFL